MYPSVWIVYDVENLPSCVYTWREHAENEQRKEGKPALTQEQVLSNLYSIYIHTNSSSHHYFSFKVRDFVDRFMPAYEKYLPSLLSEGPDRREMNGELHLESQDNNNNENQTTSIQSYHKAPVLKVIFILFYPLLFTSSFILD